MPKKLGELLLEEHLINEEQLALALEHQKKHGGVIGGILVQMGFAKERDVASALATKYGIELFNLDTVLPPPDVLHLVPKAKARQHGLVPVATDGRTLTVASADPTNFSALDDIQFITGLKVVQRREIASPG